MKDGTRPAAVNSFFPRDCYTPFGYIDNPFHSAIINPSGVFRTVPPLGMGFWCRDLPFPYGDGFGLRRLLNYLSFVMPGLIIDDTILLTEQDFQDADIMLYSDYHTKNILTYCFSCKNCSVSISFFVGQEDMLLGKISLKQESGSAETEVFLRHLYGYPQIKWWGTDGFTGKWDEKNDCLITKCFAYGDVFSVIANEASQNHLITNNEEALQKWCRTVLKSDAGEASSIAPEPIYGALRYVKHLVEGEEWSFDFALVRDKNTQWALEKGKKALTGHDVFYNQKIHEDIVFYQGMPILTGDWPDVWRRGWIYHFETVRMTIREPTGIYKHPWDGMQVHTPRQVLGETIIDCMLLSYADMALAKMVILGTFQDAIAPHIPCTREDGSVNMISQDGEECATSPIWVLLFPSIRSIFLRSRDTEWLKALYPFLKQYIQWWLDNRTDEEGWFHVQCSWEAQDGSKRFAIDYDNDTITCGANVTNVRTMDLQAAVADGIRDLAYYAEILHQDGDTGFYNQKFQHMFKQTQSMYVLDRFRDINGRTGKPIIIDDYFDIMMLTPYAVGMSTDEQNNHSRHLFQYFIDHPIHWLEWPSFLYIYTEGARLAGHQDISAQVVANIAEREYPKLDMRGVRSIMTKHTHGLPSAYCYRVPGVGNEFWAIHNENPGGCENYGWGSTLPTLILRNIIGFTEVNNPVAAGFYLSPRLPTQLKKKGAVYQVNNLHFDDTAFCIAITCLNPEQNTLSVKVSLTENAAGCWAAYKDNETVLFDWASPYTVILNEPMGIQILSGEGAKLCGHEKSNIEK